MSNARPARFLVRRDLPIVAAAAAAVLALLATPLAGAEGHDWPAFTAAQVEAGTVAYGQHCVFCHGAELEGLPGFPVLADAPFQERWAGRPLGDLYAFVSTNMPLGAGGRLDPATYASLIALILERNGFEPGDTALDPANETSLGVVLTFGE